MLRNLCSSRMLALAAAASAIWLAQRCLPAYGRAAQKVTIDARDAPVAEVIRQLSGQLHQPVVLDGQLPNKVSMHFEGASSDVLKSLGRVLDLDVREGKGGAMLLVRKFDHDPSPPQAQPEQMHALADSMLRLMPRVHPFTEPYGWSQDVRAFATSLTGNQAAALRSGTRLSWSDLTPPQRQSLSDVLAARVFGTPRYGWSLLSTASQDPTRSKLVGGEGSSSLVLEVRNAAGVKRIPLGIRLEGGSAP